MIKYLDTFAWVGWFHLALEQAIWKDNIKSIWFSEIDKFAKQVYQDHFPESPDLWDITQIDIDKLEDFDLLTGWFPCQDVSVAWKQSLEWWRTVLVEYLLQILEKKQPKYFVFENVKGLMSKKFNKFRESIFERIVLAWYHCNYKVLNTKDFWLPQNRERVFIVWQLSQLNFNFPQWQELTTFLTDILEEEVDDNYYLNEKQIEKAIDNRKPFTFHTWNKRWPMCLDRNELWYALALTASQFWKESRQLNIVNKPKHSNNRIYHTNWISPTINTCSWWNRQVKIYPELRKLTEIEYERLQWFPDWWSSDIVSKSQAYKQMWNAISVPVVKNIFINLFKW